MNKILFIAKAFAISVGFVSGFTLNVLANTEMPMANELMDYPEMSVDVLESRISNLTSQIDLKVTSEVTKQIRMYTTKYRKGSEKLLGKVSIYFPIFEENLRAMGLPEELKYLPIIESSLEPNAKSRVGATGLWQFMKGTAKMYGLLVNSSVDERRDPIRSTEAAFEYLRDLHTSFEDWTLALAAYNCGPGTVRKAMRNSGSKDYWEMRKYLPKETQDYVPRLIAAMYLMNYYHAHGLIPEMPSQELQFTATAKVFDRIKFSELSMNTGISLSIIQALNPAYLKNYIPENEGRFRLTLPEVAMYNYLDILGSAEIVYTNYSNLSYSASSLQRVKIETASLSTRSVMFQESNNDAHMNLGQYLASNAGNDSSSSNNPEGQSLSTSSKAAITSRKRYEYYKLGKRESLKEVAENRADVTLTNLLEINGFDINNLPKPGTIIKIKEL